jgi:hypothetical protein
MIKKPVWCVVGAISAVILGSSVARAADGEGETPGESESQSPRGQMNRTVSVLGNLGYAYSAGTGFGLSGRYQHTVSGEKGLLKSRRVKDDIGIEGALDYYHYSFDLVGVDWAYNEVVLSASVVWNLWVSNELAVYPRLGVGYGYGSFSSDLDGLGDPDGYGGVGLFAAAGVVYNLDAILLRAELGSGALNVGVAIPL